MEHSHSANLLQNKKIAYIEAGWHADIVTQGFLGFSKELKQLCSISIDDIEKFSVPGSLEIPLLCQQLAKSGQYQMIIAAGLIVDGGIYRHEFVAQTVLDAMMSVQLETEVPILSVVLTPKEFDESPERTQYFFEHFKLKGEEAANACFQVLNNHQLLTGNVSR